MPERRPTPTSLHLARLAAATPDVPVGLPESGGRLSTLHLTQPQDGGAQERWYVCLTGELILDLPQHEFVHLRVGETYRVAQGVTRTLTPVRDASVLVIA